MNYKPLQYTLRTQRRRLVTHPLAGDASGRGRDHVSVVYTQPSRQRKAR